MLLFADQPLSNFEQGHFAKVLSGPVPESTSSFGNLVKRFHEIAGARSPESLIRNYFSFVDKEQAKSGFGERRFEAIMGSARYLAIRYRSKASVVWLLSQRLDGALAEAQSHEAWLTLLGQPGIVEDVLRQKYELIQAVSLALWMEQQSPQVQTLLQRAKKNGWSKIVEAGQLSRKLGK